MPCGAKEAGSVYLLAGRQVEKILGHCGVWEESPARGPPVTDLMVEG
jgi:hypothetical protein